MKRQKEDKIIRGN